MKKFFLILMVSFMGMGLFHSCYTEDVVDNYFTFTGELIGDYISNRPELFSEFEAILDTTGVMGLLKAYGLYTCFVPTNDAMKAYYVNQGRTKRSDFTLAELKKIGYNHIIKGDTIETLYFKEGALSTMNMNARYISVSYSDTTSTIFMNGTAPIVERDVRLHNGIVHVLGQALEPTEDRVSMALASDERFTLFNEALLLTGYKSMIDEAVVEDDTYDPDKVTYNNQGHTVPEEIPEYRKFGYTILAVSDETFAAMGIEDIDDLYDYAKEQYEWMDKSANWSKYYAGSEAYKEDYKDTHNYLNRFMAYHLLDRTLLSSRFIKDFDTPHMFKTFDLYEYIPTMLENTLMEVKLDRDYVQGQSAFGIFNCLSMTDPETGLDTEDPETGVMLTDYIDKPDGGSINGYYHEIDHPLAYTQDFEKFLSSKRLRIEGSSNFKEVATNNMRGNNPEATPSVVGKTHAYQIPKGYFDNMQCTDGTRFTYIGAATCYEDFEGDEIYCRLQYNFTIKTMPIPAGKYEVRMGYQPTTLRGIAQLYWDSIPAGIPVNFSLDADDPSIGHEVPGSNPDDPYGYENDKMMRNRGYMKGPDTYWAPNKMYSYNAKNARISTRSLRYILGTYEFEEVGPHYLTVVFLGIGEGSTDSQFMLDYIEFCPTELILTENVH